MGEKSRRLGPLGREARNCRSGRRFAAGAERRAPRRAPTFLNPKPKSGSSGRRAPPRSRVRARSQPRARYTKPRQPRVRGARLRRCFGGKTHREACRLTSEYDTSATAPVLRSKAGRARVSRTPLASAAPRRAASAAERGLPGSKLARAHSPQSESAASAESAPRARALVASALPVHAATRAAPPSSGGADLLSAAGTIARGQ